MTAASVWLGAVVTSSFRRLEHVPRTAVVAQNNRPRSVGDTLTERRGVATRACAYTLRYTLRRGRTGRLNFDAFLPVVGVAGSAISVTGACRVSGPRTASYGARLRVGQ